MGMLLAVVAGNAQTANDYIVKTKNVKKVEVVATPQDADLPVAGKSAEPKDFVGRNFKFYSLCDWQEGMKFMVLPEKYDLIVKTFCEASTGNEVSSMSLRHKIMVYKGHTVSAEGHARINFVCQETGKAYYYEVPNGTFEDYCYGKMGVPTLAYLGDVDIAREKLVGKKLITKTTIYREDTEADNDGFREVKVDANKEVTVVSVGVGTRSFPVKIIVADEKGNEFYQNVAMSKTNSGMRDDEFVMDNARYAFYGSFAVLDDMMAVEGDMAEYIGKTIHNKYVTGMITKGDCRERTVHVPKMTTFTIDNITPAGHDGYVTLSLTEMESRRPYFKDVYFYNKEDIVDDEQEKKKYFGYIFAMGEGVGKNTSQQARAAIRAGRVIAGMTEDEVLLAVGEPDRVVQNNTGRKDWIYPRSKKLLIVKFGRNGLVQEYTTSAGTTQKKKAVRRKK
jgi:hypothetical protein